MSKTLTVAAGGSVPAGRVLKLTAQQADARRHLLKPETKPKKDGEDPFSWKGDSRRSFQTTAPAYFKSGEALAIEGALDRGLEIMFGAGKGADAGETKDSANKGTDAGRLALEQGKAVEVAFDQGKVAGRAEMLAEVHARNALFEALDQAVEALEKAEGDAAKAEAQAAVDKAQADVAGLSDLKA